MAAGPRDTRDISDFLGSRGLVGFNGEVWRVVFRGYDPLRGSILPGRWTPPGVLTLYTSRIREGALAEIGFRIFSEPVPPDLPHQVHQIRATANKTLYIEQLSELAELGVDITNYRGLDHRFAPRLPDYAVTQRIAEIAHRNLGVDSLLVPSARWDCLNLVLFVDRLDPDPALKVIGSQDVDWVRFKPVYERSR